MTSGVKVWFAAFTWRETAEKVTRDAVNTVVLRCCLLRLGGIVQDWWDEHAIAPCHICSYQLFDFSPRISLSLLHYIHQSTLFDNSNLRHSEWRQSPSHRNFQQSTTICQLQSQSRLSIPENLTAFPPYVPPLKTQASKTSMGVLPYQYTRLLPSKVYLENTTIPGAEIQQGVILVSIAGRSWYD